MTFELPDPRVPRSQVFKNHHDSWTFLVEVHTAGWVHLQIIGREARKRDAVAQSKAAVRAILRARDALEAG